MKGPPESLPDDFWLVSPNREFDEAFDRIGERWDTFSADVFRHFESRILAAYRNAMLECLQMRGGDITEIGLRLLVNKGTLSRWKSGEQILSFDTLLTAFAVFKTEFDSSLHFPVGTEVFRVAVRDAMTVIRRTYFQERCDELDAVELEFLHATFNSGAWRLALNLRSVPKLISAVRDINAQVRYQTLRHHGWDYFRVHSAFKNWGGVWVIFYSAISNHIVIK